MELFHHGVKGMKWGIRRYQNRDGTRTPEGKKREKNIVDINNIPRKDLIKLTDSGIDFYIPKGSKLYRSTTNKDESLSGKKYVSGRQSDIDTYYHMVQELNPDKVVYDTMYKSNQAMKVAGVKVQLETLEQIDKKTALDDPRTKRYIENGWITKDMLETPISKMDDKLLRSYAYYNPYKYDLDILNKPVSDAKTKQFMDVLKDKGYSAVVDMLDKSKAYADCPLIILNSETGLVKD